jgi:hypothetical protein
VCESLCSGTTGDPLFGSLDRMYVCMYVCMYADCTVVVVPGDPLGSDVTCHLVVVRGTPTRMCDRTDVPKVYI